MQAGIHAPAVAGALLICARHAKRKAPFCKAGSFRYKRWTAIRRSRSAPDLRSFLVITQPTAS